MEIRRLHPSDAPAYRTLRLRALWEHPEAFTSSYAEDERQPLEVSQRRLADAGKLFWGAFEAGELCGMVGLEREQRAKNRHKGTVVGMYVAAEYAGRGIGRALMNALLTGARHEGLQLLVLTVTEGDGPALRLYERAGFRSFGIEPNAIQVDGHAYAKNHMVLELKQSP
jgi:ribosomal protein S18 acetylase RimI-like enzyme